MGTILIHHHYADHLTMGTGNGEPDGGVNQGSESAYGDCTRRSTASNETGDAGALVRHRAGDGDGGVRTDAIDRGYFCFLCIYDANNGQRVLMILAGLPPTTALSGTSLVTTAPAATTALRPMVTPGQMMAPMHIHAFSLMVT